MIICSSKTVIKKHQKNYQRSAEQKTANADDLFLSSIFSSFFKGRPGRAGERTWDLLTLFILSFHHFTAEPQRLPYGMYSVLLHSTVKK
jgi:hypothetical protein